MPAEGQVFVETFQYETLVLRIEFRRNYVKNFVDIEFFSFVPIITCYIDLVQIENVSLFFDNILNVVRVYIRLNRCRHTTDNQIKSEQLHHLLMDELINRTPAFPRLPQ